MRIAILGARGFLGRNLGKFLLAKNHNVVGYVLHDNPENKSDFECRSIVDLLENEAPLESPFDVVINLAARRSTRVQPFTENQVNWFTFEIPKKFVLKTSGPQTLVLNSSTYIQNYGGQTGYSVDSYGAAKEKLSRFLETHSNLDEFKTKDLFFFTLYGDGDRASHLLPSLLNAAMTRNQILLSPGNQLMNLLYIDDAVQNIYSAMIHQINECYQKNYVWRDEYFSVRELVEKIQLVTGREINCSWGGRDYVGHEMMEPWDIPMGQLPDFADPTSLEEGISRIWQSMQKV
jgi:nucleoside-diphosphate-sugar epimerase